MASRAVYQCADRIWRPDRTLPPEADFGSIALGYLHRQFFLNQGGRGPHGLTEARQERSGRGAIVRSWHAGVALDYPCGLARRHIRQYAVGAFDRLDDVC